MAKSRNNEGRTKSKLERKKKKQKSYKRRRNSGVEVKMLDFRGWKFANLDFSSTPVDNGVKTKLLDVGHIRINSIKPVYVNGLCKWFM